MRRVLFGSGFTLRRVENELPKIGSIVVLGAFGSVLMFLVVVGKW